MKSCDEEIELPVIDEVTNVRKYLELLICRYRLTKTYVLYWTNSLEACSSFTKTFGRHKSKSSIVLMLTGNFLTKKKSFKPNLSLL